MPPASQVDYDRWRSVWVFLSSGMVSKCTTELWLDFLSDGQSFEWIAERLEAWFPRPEFKQEFRLVHHDLISQFEHKHGPAAVFELTAWKDYVFIHGGSDRASEAFWSSICYKRYHSSRRRSSGLIGKGETSSIVEDLGSVLVISGRILDEKFRNIPSASEQIFICSADTLSGFDQESLRATVRVISSCNLFCVAWAQRMSSVSPEFLSSLLTSETENFQVKFGIGTDSSMLGFPGDWPALCFLRRRGYLGGQSKITG
jgi:hypothetical protein